MARKPAPPSGDRRQQILDAALDLFAEQGLEGATSKDIAERAEVTHGLIYFYFKSKEELFKSAFDNAIERAMSELNVDSILESGAPPEQAIQALLTRFLETLTSPRVLAATRLMMHTMARQDWHTGPLHDCKLKMGDSVKSIVASVRTYLDRQVELGTIHPIDTSIVAQFLIGGIVSSVRWAKASEPIVRLPSDAAATITGVCMRGLLTAPSTPAESATTDANTFRTVNALAFAEQ